MLDEFEMFSTAGNDACQQLLDNLTRSLDLNDLNATRQALRQGMNAISSLHPEVFDTEPRYHFNDRLRCAVADALVRSGQHRDRADDFAHSLDFV